MDNVKIAERLLGIVKELMGRCANNNKTAKSITASAGPYTILRELAEDWKKYADEIDLKRWGDAMGHAKGADYIVGKFGEKIVHTLIRHEMGLEDDAAAIKAIKQGIKEAVIENRQFEGLRAENAFEPWRKYVREQRRERHAASELVKLAKGIIGAGDKKVLELITQKGHKIKINVDTDVGDELVKQKLGDATGWSEEQVSFVWQDGGWQALHNTGAKNPTLLNGKKWSRNVELKNGDVISVGRLGEKPVLPLKVRIV